MEFRVCVCGLKESAAALRLARRRFCLCAAGLEVCNAMWQRLSLCFPQLLALYQKSAAETEHLNAACVSFNSTCTQSTSRTVNNASFYLDSVYSLLCMQEPCAFVCVCAYERVCARAARGYRRSVLKCVSRLTEHWLWRRQPREDGERGRVTDVNIQRKNRRRREHKQRNYLRAAYFWIVIFNMLKIWNCALSYSSIGFPILYTIWFTCVSSVFKLYWLLAEDF